jgi:hypothetical protein
MDIPKDCLEVFQNGFQRIGSANSDLKPSQSVAYGILMNSIEEQVTVFVQKEIAGRLVDDCLSTEKAVIYANFGSHEAFQIKGKVLECRPITENELSESDKYRSQLMQPLPEGLAILYDRIPDIAIKIQIEKIFDQTPGPNAGKHIL